MNFIDRYFNSLVLLGTVTAFFLLLYALYSQHINGFEPCVKCIYQRVAMLLVLFTGCLVLLGRKVIYLQLISLFGVLASSIYGFLIAHSHVGVIDGSVLEMCSFYPEFGFLGRLDLTIPFFFYAGGDCSDISWKMFSLTMPEWMRIIFSVYMMMSVLLIIFLMGKIKENFYKFLKDSSS